MSEKDTDSGNRKSSTLRKNISVAAAILLICSIVVSAIGSPTYDQLFKSLSSIDSTSPLVTSELSDFIAENSWVAEGAIYSETGKLYKVNDGLQTPLIFSIPAPADTKIEISQLTKKERS